MDVTTKWLYESNRYRQFNVFERKQFQKLLSVDESDDEDQELLTLDSPVVKLANFLADLKNDCGFFEIPSKIKLSSQGILEMSWSALGESIRFEYRSFGGEEWTLFDTRNHIAIKWSSDPNRIKKKIANRMLLHRSGKDSTKKITDYFNK